jgi:hypothetical protein
VGRIGARLSTRRFGGVVSRRDRSRGPERRGARGMDGGVGLECGRERDLESANHFIRAP